MKKIIVSTFFSCLLWVTSLFAVGQINIASVPYVINTSGSYILVKDLTTSSNQTAIAIYCSNVTLDLNGHTLFGAGSTSGSAGTGILCTSTSNNITIFNGMIQDFRLDGMLLVGNNYQIQRMQIINNGRFGIGAGSSCIINDNIIRGNSSSGIAMSNNAVIRDNIVKDNGGYGIEGVSGCSITGNSCYTNGSAGIHASLACVVTENNVYQNGGIGIDLNYGCTVMGNSVYENGNDGINTGFGCTVKNNTCRSNTGDGIEVTSDCQVMGNTCNSNGLSTATASGIRTTSSDNNIENNLMSDNDIGLLLGASGSFYASNRASGNTLGNYSTVGSQTDGGDTNSALTNFAFYNQLNVMVQSISGFDIPAIRESPQAVLHHLIW